jgi:Flp pilus assembly protein TadG
MWRKFYHRREGQAVVLAALAFVVLVGATGLALDGANAYNQRRNANNAADAASLAGARALLEASENSGTNGDVLAAITTYLDGHLPDTSNRQITAYYIDGTGSQAGAINSSTAADDVPAVDIASSASVHGVAVEIHWTFNTFFMPLLGQDTLTVEGYGLSLVGALGGATGPDLIPLAIRDTPASDWQRSPQSAKDQEWSLMVYTDTLDITTPPRTIRQYNLRHIALIPIQNGNSAPVTGTNSSSCSGVTTPADTLVYWWCNGTEHAIETKDAIINTSNMPPPGNLKDEMSTRVGQDVLLPVYNQVDLTGRARVVGFLAVHVTNFTGSGILKGTIISYYTAPGPITGGTIAFFDTYAINLVR